MAQWHLDRADVSWGTSLYWRDDDPFDITLQSDAAHSGPAGSTKARSRRNPRSVQRSEERITMTHRPTQLEVHGRFSGYYNRKELAVMSRALREQLFRLLEKRVGDHLRIAGR